MRKFILMTLCLCLASISIQAQQIHFIPKAGVNIANMTNSDGADPRIGLNAGVSGEIALTPEFSLEPGIFYSMQGVKESDSGITGTLKNDYLNVPVLAKYYVYEGFNLFAGPQVGFLVNSKLSTKTSGVSASVDIKDLFKTVDFALVFGAGYQTALGLNFSVNYNLGLVNVFDGGTVNIGGQTINTEGEESKNGVLQVNVGWRF